MHLFIQPLDEVKEELLKNAVFLELPVEDVLPVPVAKKAKLSLGALTSLKKSEKTSSSAAAAVYLRVAVYRKRLTATSRHSR
jgi:hypothetical protein